MLHERQRILVGPHLVQDPVYERRVSDRSKYLERTHDGVLELLSSHAWSKKLALANRFWQTEECVAMTEEFRPHRQDNKDRVFGHQAGYHSAGTQPP